MHRRRASSDDAEALVEVTQAAVEDLSGAHYSEAERSAWLESISVEAMRHGLQSPDTVTFVAETEKEAIGFSTLAGEKVRAVYVRPEFQGEGVGSDLLDAVEMEARAGEPHRLKVSASLNSVGFYEAHGYQRREPSTVEFEDGVEIRCTEMEKRL